MTDAGRDLSLIACGHRLRARWFAPRRPETQDVIVLLHQGLGSITQWRTFPGSLAAATGCAVVGYDRWGHGGSERLVLPRAPAFLQEEAESALPQVLDGLGLDRAIIYGHSDGGTIALLFAAAFPRRARAVISEAAHVFSEVGATGGLTGVVADFESGDLRRRLERHHGDNVESMFRGWADLWRSPAMRDWRMTDRLAAIRCPVLALQGSDDEHGSIKQVEAIVTGVGGPVENWIIPGCGHSPHLEATEAVARRCAEFTARYLPR